MDIIILHNFLVHQELCSIKVSLKILVVYLVSFVYNLLMDEVRWDSYKTTAIKEQMYYQGKGVCPQSALQRHYFF